MMEIPDKVEEYKYKYFKYLYKLRRLEGCIACQEMSLYSDTSDDLDIESIGTLDSGSDEVDSIFVEKPCE